MMLRLVEQRRDAKDAKDSKEQWLEQIHVDAIRPNPYQPRRTFSEESIDELSSSIEQYGLINPISVRKLGTGYELIAGERRLRAVRRLGMTHINAIVVQAKEQDSAVIAMIENLQRENLHFLEEAEGYQRLIRNHGLTQDELAKKLGKNQSTVANRLRLLRLSPSVRKAIVIGRLTERHARALLRIPEEAMQLKIITIVCNMRLSVASTEELVQKTIDKMYGCEPLEKNPKKVMRIMRDSRLLVNSIKKFVDAMKSSGLGADFKMEEKGETVCIEITLPWRQQPKNPA
jgi:ParB family chromosome partitioning protein